MDPETFAIGHGKPLFWDTLEHQLPREETTSARRKPLHMRKGEMYACKIREPRDTKRCTLVGSGYYLGMRLAASRSCSLLAAVSVTPHSTAQASEQFVRREWFYEIGNHVVSHCLRLRPLVRIGGYEDRGDCTIRGDQTPM
jgi:hypothetical protein